MAQSKAVLPTEVIKQLETLEREADSIIDKMLDAGVQALKPEIERNLRWSIQGEYATGELEKSLVVKNIKGGKLSYKGRFVTFNGNSRLQRAKNGRIYKRKTPARLNEIAAVLEYGKSDQPPRPFLRPAFIEKNEAIVQAMEEVFDRETKKFQG